MTDAIKVKSAGRPKSLEKRAQILDCASKLLLMHGYVNTSMDAIAKESGVSKQTVYSHFNNKDALYNAIIESKCEMYQINEQSIFNDTLPLEEVLINIGIRFIKLLTDENVIAMYKVVIGESKQDSNVAKLFYDAGPLHSIELVTNLMVQHEQSKLNHEQARETSHDFFNLLKSDYHMPSMLHLQERLTNEDINTLAKSVAKKTMLIVNMHKQELPR